MTIYIINNNNKVYEDEKEDKCKLLLLLLLLLYQREIRNCRKNKLIKLSRFNIYIIIYINHDIILRYILYYILKENNS